MHIVTNVEWEKGLDFKADIYGYKVSLSGDKKEKGMATSPKNLMLIALGGCTGMDVISILEKMKIKIDYFNVKVEGNTRDEHPKKFTDMKVIYELKGENIDIDKVRKAVELSRDKYCSVFAFYKDTIKIDYEIVIL